MSLFPSDLTAAARVLLARAEAAGVRIATAESCTGGLIAGLLTEIAGSSSVVSRGFVTYSNEAKNEMLGVRAEVLESDGAVSEATVRAMAEGALSRAVGDADLAVSVSGVAGPGGGSAEKPVGLVWFGLAGRGETLAEHHVFPGDRGDIRLATVVRALALLDSRLG